MQYLAKSILERKFIRCKYYRICQKCTQFIRYEIIRMIKLFVIVLFSCELLYLGNLVSYVIIMKTCKKK